MNKYSKHIKLILILMAITFIVFLPYILGDRPFLFSADQQLQYNYFYREYQRMLQDFIVNKTFPFYSFNTYLGNNFYASKLYYLSGDIFMPVLMLFKNVDTGLMWITLFLVVLSGFNFSLYLRGFGLKRESVIIALSIIYGFSGIASIYIGQYMFHRFYAFLPLLMLGIELYCRKKRLVLFTLITFVLALTNYYFLFPTCLFMVIYYFFTNYYHGKPFNVFNYIKSAFPLISAFLTGILLAGFLLVPGIIYISQNERIGDFTFALFFELKVYLGFIFNFISAPLTLFTNYGYMFNSGANGHLSWYSIYTGAISAPIIFSLFTKKNKNNKEKAIFITELILIVSALIPTLSSVFHGFSESSMRWMFIITFFHTLISAIYLTHFENKISEMLKGSANYLVVFTAAGLLMFLFVKLEILHLIYLSICLLLLVGYFYLLKKGLFKYILIFTVLEVTVMMSLHLYLLNSTYYRFNPTLDENALNYYQEMDEDKFYRLYINPQELLPTSTMNLNQAINMNFKSTTTYDSTIEPNLKVFNRLNGFNWHMVDIHDFNALKMLGVKYYLVSDESMLPEGNFTYYNNVNHLKMYLIEDYLPIGFTYSKFKTAVETVINEEGIIVSHDLDYLNELLIDEQLEALVSDINSGERSKFELIEYYNDNHLYGYIHNQDKQVLYFSIPYSEGWKVYDNDTLLSTYKVQGGFIGVVLEPGEHYLTLQFTPPGFKQGIYTSILGGIGFISLIFYEMKVKKNEKG